jgi:hypothetical protein
MVDLLDLGMRRTFRIEDWRAVVEAAIREAEGLFCSPTVASLEEPRTNPAPKKRIRIALTRSNAC